MTFRDKSAYTTLNGANMGDFEKWANSQGIGWTGRTSAALGWQGRQPEIDAHRAVIQMKQDECDYYQSEIKKLKVENERLRADAERYRFQKAHNFRFFPDSGEWDITGFHNDILASGNADTYEQALDAAIKDFSTTQKEDGAR